LQQPRTECNVREATYASNFVAGLVSEPVNGVAGRRSDGRIEHKMLAGAVRHAAANGPPAAAQPGPEAVVDDAAQKFPT
jgi:hypothetical protein